jgi:2-keto-4-pentenoate hydratase
MERQLGHRRVRLEAGEKSIGWKVGFGSPQAMQRLAIQAPLVGFLTDGTLLPTNSRVSIGGWVKPAVEPEIAVHMGEALAGTSDRQTAREAIAALGPAIELADVDPPPSDVEAILAGNIFNRHVILGRADASRAGCVLDGMIGRVYQAGVESAKVEDLQALTGDLVEIVRSVAALLADVGVGLQSGEVIIAGSIVAPIWVDGSTQIRYTLEPVDGISVQLVA